MRDFVIMTDSCCDLTAQMADELGLVVLPLQLLIGEETFSNYLDGREIGFKEYKDILYLGFSSALSTTYQSAAIAAETMHEEFPEAKVYAVDTLTASLGQGMLVYLCAQQKADGKSIEEVRDYAEATKLNICHWVTVDDLNHLKRGGRISATTALVGSMLAIKPIIHVDNEGRLINVGKARGRKPSLMTLVNEMEKRAIDPQNQTIFISHGDCEDDVQIVADEIRKRFGVKTIHINYVGPVIGSHTGAGVVALFFVGKER